MVPQQTISASANYRWENFLGLVDYMNINVNYVGTGKIYWLDNNETSSPYYGLLNAKISFVKSFIGIDFWAKNITNQKYTAFYFESFGKWAQNGRPFSFGGNLTLSF